MPFKTNCLLLIGGFQSRSVRHIWHAGGGLAAWPTGAVSGATISVDRSRR
jgi:hypothetical protein